MRRISRFKVGAGAVVMSVGGPVSPTSSAFARNVAPAYDLDALCTSSNDGRYVFEDGVGTWTGPEKAAARAGFNGWRALRSESAGLIANIRELNVAPRLVVVRGVPGPTPGAYQDLDGDGWNDYQTRANCTKMQISSPGTELAQLQRSSAHEMGHALGLRHTGRKDSRPAEPHSYGSGFYEAATSGEVPLVNGNCSGYSHDGSPSNDDWASLARRSSAPVVTADSGFESGVRAEIWRGTDVVTQTTSSPSGAFHVSIGANTSLEQRVRIMHWTTQQFRTRGHYKAADASAGTIGYKTWGKRLSYGSWECGAPSYVDTDWFLIWGSNPALTTSWANHVPSYHAWSGAPANYAFELRLEIFNGTVNRLFLDNTRLEVS